MIATMNAPAYTEDRQAFFEKLYIQAFPGVARHIGKGGGSLDDAKDIFHDALIIYYEKLVSGSLPVHYSEPAYIYGIARHLWAKKKSAANNQPLTDNTGNIPETETISTPDANKLLAYLEQAGKKCMDLLKAFYYDKLTLKQVTDKFDYSGERSATVQKYKCLEKIRETVKQKSLGYADFLE